MAASTPQTLIEQWRLRPAWARSDRSGWRNFAIAMGALAMALVLALYSSTAAESGWLWLAATSALTALGVAAWVAIVIVPALARRTQLRWLTLRIDYRLTREGVICLCAVMVVALAALNTGNNLLFMILATLLAGILVSGVVSQAVLSGVELRIEVPEHIFAGQPVVALVELVNHKQALPSFSLRLSGEVKPPKKGPSGAGTIFTQPIHFPYLPRRRSARQDVELRFPQRGLYRQDVLRLQTRFPFGFLEKGRAIESNLEAMVYPAVEPTEEFYEILPLVSGELESYMRGRGHDLYSIRDYQTSDSARHVDWKATAKTGVLQVREFTREDERRVLLVLDPFLAPSEISSASVEASFDRGVTLCASLAWHFHEVDSALAFRTAGFETPMAPAGEIIHAILGHLATAAPRTPEAGRTFLEELADSPHVFKIILTRQPRGSIPTSLWSSSYILFADRWK